MIADVKSEAAKKAQLAGMLERICRELELTESQFKMAESRYLAVGKWLANADDPLVRGADIYSQGSISLGTTVRPLRVEEFDVDLVSFHPGLTPATPPPSLKAAIGERLRLNSQYRDILEEKARCWRLHYANEFHMDITPAIPNPACSQGGELVPEKRRPEWKPTNPKGYRAWFEELARVKPRLELTEAELVMMRAQLEPLPAPTGFKGILKRIVQLMKRHRDIWFENRDAQIAPVSIVITTLAAESYAYTATSFTYESEMDLLLDTLRNMPLFIEQRTVSGRLRYYVWNRATEGENFAEKWNRDTRLAQAFFAWHQAAVEHFEALAPMTGLDQITKHLSRSLGDRPVTKALTTVTQSVSEARAEGRLAVAAGLGLVTEPSHGIPVRRNTFFGR